MVDCPIDSTYLAPPLRTEEFEALAHLLKIASICQDVSVVKVIDAETVDASVLPHLAEQYNVNGYKGWLLADTEEKQRTLIGQAFNLHRKAGTPGAIIDALAAVGFTVTSIDENPPLLCDGSVLCNGAEVCNEKKWDRFIVNFETEPNGAQVVLVDALIDVWKNERSRRIFQTNLLVCDGTVLCDGSEVADGLKGN